MTAIEYDAAFERPAFLARLLHLGPRSGALLGLGFWFAAWAVLGLHVAHAAGLGGGLVFVTTEVWLLTGACLGIPVMALRVLGIHLTPPACVVIGSALSAAMVALTVLYASGTLRPRPANAMAGLILCSGMAMRCFNAAEALRAMRSARREHGTECVMADTMAEHELAAALAPLSVDERAQLLALLTTAVRRRSCRPVLHAVDDDPGTGTGTVA